LLFLPQATLLLFPQSPPSLFVVFAPLAQPPS